jgi:hypothetical protein
MPKGRMGISGSGPFFRITLPRETDGEPSDDQKRLLALNELKTELLGDLDKRRSTPLSPEDGAKFWSDIIHAAGGYLGQSKRGLPPTEADSDRELAKIAKAASRLEDEIINADFHVIDLLAKTMGRGGADLSELKRHLAMVAEILPLSQTIRRPKGRPDPYLEPFLRELVDIWATATGKFPGKTGEDHYRGGRTSPFFRWCNKIGATGITEQKKIPRDLLDKVIELSKPDGQIG